MTVKDLRDILNTMRPEKQVQVRIEGDDSLDVPVIDYRIFSQGIILIIKV